MGLRLRTLGLVGRVVVGLDPRVVQGGSRSKIRQGLLRLLLCGLFLVLGSVVEAQLKVLEGNVGLLGGRKEERDRRG